MSDKAWNPEVERIRKAMMERFSDKLSMEEIAEFAYSLAVAPAPQPANYALALDVVDAIEWIDQNEPKRARDVLAEVRDKLRAAVTPQVTPAAYFCSECDDKNRCASAETCYAGHSGYPRRTIEGTSEQAPQVESAPELELEQEADGRWLAAYTRFPGVAAYGPLKEEAIRNAAKVLIEATPASPTTEKCPTCGSPAREYFVVEMQPTKHEFAIACSDAWHSSPGTTKGTK